MTNPLRLNAIEFNGGQKVDTDEADIVVLVGPNNVGKSRTLQEIHQFLMTDPNHPHDPRGFFAVERVEIEKMLDVPGLEEWLVENRYIWQNLNEPSSRMRTAQMGEMLMDLVRAHWRQNSTSIGQVAGHLVRGLWCGERLSYLGQPSRIGPSDHPEHAIHWLARKPELMQKFRDAFLEAFGANVILDAWGSALVLRLSRDSVQGDFQMTTSDGMPDEAVVASLGALPTIEMQSDGVRSFAGILLTLLASQFPLVLLDEPEAFLHPPQARLLGRSLASLQGDGQLVVATHSLDVLLGLVETRPSRVMIVRLTRSDERTTSRQLSTHQLNELWSSPLLRFSRALDGLFHEGVVVCEGDTDTQFFSGVEDEADLSGGRDIMFSYAGGKQRISVVTSALAALGVPVRAVVDFDGLRDIEFLRTLVQSMGGHLTETMERNQRILDAQLRAGPKLTVEAAQTAVGEALGEDATRVITNSDRERIKDALAPSSGWVAAKRGGLGAIPAGDATNSAVQLVDELKDAGVWVVPVGEVEGFVKSVGGHGPKWVGEVIEGGHIAGAAEAKAFVADLLGSFV